MDVFELRNQVIREYSDFIRSFITIRDERIREVVDREIRSGLLRPESPRPLRGAVSMRRR